MDKKKTTRKLRLSEASTLAESVFNRAQNVTHHFGHEIYPNTARQWSVAVIRKLAETLAGFFLVLNIESKMLQWL